MEWNDVLGMLIRRSFFKTSQRATTNLKKRKFENSVLLPKKKPSINIWNFIPNRFKTTAVSKKRSPDGVLKRQQLSLGLRLFRAE
jgi:hypothetical protein